MFQIESFSPKNSRTSIFIFFQSPNARHFSPWSFWYIQLLTKKKRNAKDLMDDVAACFLSGWIGGKKKWNRIWISTAKKKKLIKRTDGHDHIGQMKVLFLSQRVCNEWMDLFFFFPFFTDWPMTDCYLSISCVIKAYVRRTHTVQRTLYFSF